MITLKPLPYNYDALEPYLDAATMAIHHDKHHQAYVDNYNKAIAKYPDLTDKPLEEILKNLNSLPVEEIDRVLIKNHGGGVANHDLFWQVMNPANQPDQNLQEEIKKTFNSIDEFKAKFTEAALKHFGSGWAWLCRQPDSQLKICALPNQDSPLTLGGTPLLCLDVWEHAYYLKYQNKRADYITAWWSVVLLLRL